MSRVKLNGYVCSDADKQIYDWFDIPAFSPKMVTQAIDNNPAGEDLVLEINSGGGSVFAGFEMYSTLQAAPCNTVAEVYSLAASAASTLICGCKSVLMSPVAQVMIHPPSTGTWGDETEHQRSLDVLQSISKSIVNGYVAKCKGKTDRATLERLTAKTSWFTAQEAVDMGIADGILFQEDEPLPENITNSIGSGIRAMAGGGLDLDTMRAQYAKAMAKAEPKADWTAQAALDLEKIRY